MLNRKIIAQNITNLTDARYFAAWGVDYLSYNIQADSPYAVSLEAIKEIKDWVEGPKTLIESNAIEFLDFSDGHILSNIYSSLPLNKEAFFRIDISEVQKGLPSGKYILRLEEDDIDTFKALPTDKYVEADVYLDIQNLNLNRFSDWPNLGLAVQGGEEEKVGVKSFDELDELYELLLDESYD
ncbi:MAG: hypothetical protein HKN09_09780 [Saprospiraceae bacterium]|nr:hypothetical protein [Saprospiraceae bacterium]